MPYEKNFTLKESEQFTFFRIPKALFTCTQYNAVSAEAKLLYGLLLDRMGLSIKNEWCDSNGRVFIYFTIEEAMKYFRCGHEKVGKLFCELEKVGLIDRRKQGQGHPSIIYVQKFISDSGKADAQNSTFQQSRHRKIRR